MKKNSWTLKNVIFTAMIALVFGLIYMAWGILWNVFINAVGPLVGFMTTHNLTGALAGEAVTGKVVTAITIGLWMTAGPLAAMIIKKPGAALFGEVLASMAEMTMGSAWGMSNLIWGFMQGAGSELGFAMTGYKKWNAGLWLSVITGSLVAFVFNYFKYAYNTLPLIFILVLMVLYVLSVFIFAGILVWLIYKLLLRAKIIAK